MTLREELIKELKLISNNSFIYQDEFESLADWILADRKRIVEPLVKALKEISIIHHDYCDYYKFKSLNNCRCPSYTARKALKNIGIING